MEREIRNRQIRLKSFSLWYFTSYCVFSWFYFESAGFIVMDPNPVRNIDTRMCSGKQTVTSFLLRLSFTYHSMVKYLFLFYIWYKFLSLLYSTYWWKRIFLFYGLMFCSIIIFYGLMWNLLFFKILWMDVNSSLLLYSMGACEFFSFLIFYGRMWILLYYYILWMDRNSPLLLYSMVGCKFFSIIIFYE